MFRSSPLEVVILAINWDRWRKNYDQMGWDDQVRFYNSVERQHPDQKFYSAWAVRRLLQHIMEPVRVLEIGGWKGELAAEVYTDQIIEWLNIEVIKAAEQFGPKGDWYDAIVPEDYIWNIGLPQGYDLLVMSHTIEHVTGEQLALIVQQFDGEWAYFEAPLLGEHHDHWEGYNGSHILELGWNEVDDLMALSGFEKVYQNDQDARYPDARIVYYQRERHGQVEEAEA
jgi:hypothetical protein